jgi:predicted nucleic acid-binding protein
MKPVAEALLDSNVVIAAVAEAHEHHQASAALFELPGEARYAVGAHSYAEAYATLTRRSANAPFRWAPGHAWQALESVAAATRLVGLSPPQTLETIRLYATGGNIGARLYDSLIGRSAILHAIPRIITWNVAHMRALFPTLEVIDPAESVRRR